MDAGNPAYAGGGTSGVEAEASREKGRRRLENVTNPES
jgi:hypothetical protein